MNPLNYICHRKPERTFKIKGHYFPVCSRCTGFYISLFAYFTYAYFNYIDYNLFVLSIAILLLVPTAIDGTTQFFGRRESNNKLRFVTGIIGGLGLGIIIKMGKWYLYTL